jgi:hypothetical protein
MIKITSYRDRTGEHFVLPSRQVSIGKALQSLLYFELGFGGQIVKWDKEQIEVQTHVFGTQDTTIFTGSEVEMMPLHEAAYAYVTVQKDSFDKDVDRFMKFTSGNALLVTCAGGGMPEALLGNRRSEAIGCLVATKDQELTKKVLATFNDREKSHEDVFAFIELVYDEGVDAAKKLLEAS